MTPCLSVILNMVVCKSATQPTSKFFPRPLFIEGLVVLRSATPWRRARRIEGLRRSRTGNRVRTMKERMVLEMLMNGCSLRSDQDQCASVISVSLMVIRDKLFLAIGSCFWWLVHITCVAYTDCASQCAHNLHAYWSALWSPDGIYKCIKPR